MNQLQFQLSQHTDGLSWRRCRFLITKRLKKKKKKKRHSGVACKLFLAVLADFPNCIEVKATICFSLPVLCRLERVRWCKVTAQKSRGPREEAAGRCQGVAS